MAKAAEGGAARLSGSDEGEGKRSDGDGKAKDGGRRRSKAKLPTADRSRASPGAESSRSPMSCSDPRPTKPEAAEAAPTEAESCRRSPSLPPAAQAAAFVHCFTWNIYFALFHVKHFVLFHVKHFALFHVKHFRILLQIVPRGTLYIVK